MKASHKSIITTALTAVALAGVANAASVFVDFSNTSTATNTGTDTYNTLANPTEGNAATPLATSGNISASNLSDITGATTTVDINVTTYNNGGGQLRGNGGTGGTAAHVAEPGVEELAYNDGFWINNHNSNGTGAGNEFGFVITFSDLTEAAYDLTLLAGSSNLAGSWTVTTGTGDSDVIGYTGQDDVMSWTNVAPVGGEIVITSTAVPTNSNYQNASISFASINVVPEPSSTALLGLGGLALLLRRRK